MRNWKLKITDPRHLVINADARLTPVNYLDDQIWELVPGSGDPPALALHTTFGLRAIFMRIFPRFEENNEWISNPGSFSEPITFHTLNPNYIKLSCSPLPDLNVQIEYWVPGSNGCCNRLTIVSNAEIPRRIKIEWVCQLSPISGERMSSQEFHAATILVGKTSGLIPILISKGGMKPDSGVFPSLAINYVLEKGEPDEFIWSLGACYSLEDSVSIAKSYLSRNWEAELSRIELLDNSNIDVFSANEEIDKCLMLSQKNISGLLINSTSHLPHDSFVLSRLPDLGYSIRGDGMDYGHLWNGQSALEAFILIETLLPTNPLIAEGILKNFLFTQTEDGFIDFKPGLAGQRCNLLAPPIFAYLSWRIFESTANITFLEEVFPKLISFINYWFSSENDRDEDGIPEYSNPIQIGFDNHLIYSLWNPDSLGIQISTFENCSLCCFLYKECLSLEKIAEKLRSYESIPALHMWMNKVKLFVESAWDEETSRYIDRDRDTHNRTNIYQLTRQIGPGDIVFNRDFDDGMRLVIMIEYDSEIPHDIEININPHDETFEKITFEKIKWFQSFGRITSTNKFIHLEEINFKGFNQTDKINVYTVGMNFIDISQLLPLWAGIPSPEIAAKLIEKTIENPDLYWKKYGLACYKLLPGYDTVVSESDYIDPFWMHMIMSGLINYHYNDLAAELFIKLTECMNTSLRKNSSFKRFYHQETGDGIGERNYITGGLSLSLFLEIIGLRIYSPKKYQVKNLSPFQFPISINFRGTQFSLTTTSTKVKLPDGQVISILPESIPQIIEL